jgi:hypothetical protein
MFHPQKGKSDSPKGLKKDAQDFQQGHGGA